MLWNGLEIPENTYYQEDDVVIYCGDCREILPLIPDKSIPLLLTDPPYGITSNKWDDGSIPPVRLWLLIKDLSNTFVITASQPYSSSLVLYAEDIFKHEWIWLKNRGSNFANTVREPMKEHEHILVFSHNSWIYNPQMQSRSGGGNDRIKYKVDFRTRSQNYKEFTDKQGNILSSSRVPSSVQLFNTEVGLHPTQKPCSLFEYLILTYSNANQIILEPFLGSGTTAYCAKKLGRKCIGIEIEEKYCEIAVKRLSQQVFNFKEAL